MSRLIATTTLAVLMSSSLPAFAHHSSAPHFDRDKEITITGRVTELKFVNPHAYIYVDVDQGGGTVNWRCEMSAATMLKRIGWSKDMFTIGQGITIEGAAARREDNVCLFISAELDDGRSIDRNSNLIAAGAVAPTEAAADYSENRPLYLENGQPNLKGPWVTLSFGPRSSVGFSPRYVATPAGKTAAEGYDMAFDDPILKCRLVDIFGGWNHDQNVNDIYQTDDTVTLQYGFMDAVRTVHLDVDKHPENIEPSVTGHSIGWFEGDTLVIDTIGFEEGILDHFSGLKNSGQMHSVERIRYDPDTKRLMRDYTIADPLYLVGEAKGQDGMKFATEPYSPYGCVELSGKNNIRPGDDVVVRDDGTVVLPDDSDSAVVPTAAERAELETPVSAEATIGTNESASQKSGSGTGFLIVGLLAVLGFGVALITKLRGG